MEGGKREHDAKCERERREKVELGLGGKWTRLGEGGRGKVRKREASEMKS